MVTPSAQGLWGGVGGPGIAPQGAVTCVTKFLGGSAASSMEVNLGTWVVNVASELRKLTWLCVGMTFAPQLSVEHTLHPVPFFQGCCPHVTSVPWTI
jgi:hypothetical protein